MKKLLFVLAIGAFAACGSGESTETKTDSTAVKADTTAAPVTPAPDTTKVDTNAAKVDTTTKK